MFNIAEHVHLPQILNIEYWAGSFKEKNLLIVSIWKHTYLVCEGSPSYLWSILEGNPWREVTSWRGASAMWCCKRPRICLIRYVQGFFSYHHILCSTKIITLKISSRASEKTILLCCKNGWFICEIIFVLYTNKSLIVRHIDFKSFISFHSCEAATKEVICFTYKKISISLHWTKLLTAITNPVILAVKTSTTKHNNRIPDVNIT